MLGLFKSKKLYEAEAQQAYQSLLTQCRMPVFYAHYGVPDSYDGRFELLLLHAFFVYNRLIPDSKAEVQDVFSQALFDEMFRQLDLGLREAGAGDMSVPKHMRRMMLAHNGRVHVYQKALGSDEDLQDALRRNLYGTAPETPAGKIDAMGAYVHDCLSYLAGQDENKIRSGYIDFPSPEPGP